MPADQTGSVYRTTGGFGLRWRTRSRRDVYPAKSLAVIQRLLQ